MLYAKCNDSNEDQLPEAAESSGPREIKTSDIGDSGDDLLMVSLLSMALGTY